MIKQKTFPATTSYHLVLIAHFTFSLLLLLPSIAPLSLTDGEVFLFPVLIGLYGVGVCVGSLLVARLREDVCSAYAGITFIKEYSPFYVFKKTSL